MKLDTIQKDALAEFGNIGAAHAATTLSQMLMCPIEITVPDVQVVDIAEIHKYVSNEISAMIVFQIQGEVADGGYVIVSMPKQTIIQLTNLMLGTGDPDRDINEMDRSAAIEIGNIMISAFLDATGSVEFLPDNNDHDCLNCFCQVMENHLALDLLDLVPVFSRLQFLTESPFEH